MKNIKVHICNNKRAWYTPKGRLWHVEDRGVQLSYRTIEEMLGAHPEFTSIPEMQASVDRHIEKTEKRKVRQAHKESENIKRENQPKARTEKMVTCYYCFGTGKTGLGMPCTNCQGKGVYLVTAKGF
ncbi:hypothetical protein EV198_2276 [Roseivirga ehrenbergii]|uniref:Uncharacterized protein n=1 Tax=Roseivirga ehrenbergii (strain DSM 102268 / JCM 13514 / KCTC 12282 / NCIMB 14502 / KMM 6017) TaxID=279360 RepID=A0A150XPG2_ROSEK|nr:hypothetical protein [Roseivirga ehrenbergii]KYG80594.1 hypothetical protein MB14_15720 [Roseivirga ehrenbergii]TCL07841.1 hypothetical protein EV198_2276 [Roseivirga ehrenbergii]